MRPSTQSKSGPGRFDPDHIVVLDWLCKPVVALGATTKSYDNWSGHLRSRPLVGFVCDKNVGWAPKSHPHFHSFFRMGISCPPYFFTNYRGGLWGPPYNLDDPIGVDFGATPINSHPLLSAEGRLLPSTARPSGSRRRRHRVR